jgi:hypothetical protein
LKVSAVRRFTAETAKQHALMNKGCAGRDFRSALLLIAGTTLNGSRETGGNYAHFG